MVNKKVLQEIIQFKNEVDEVVNDLKSGKLQNAVAAEATNAIYEDLNFIFETAIDSYYSFREPKYYKRTNSLEHVYKIEKEGTIVAWDVGAHLIPDTHRVSTEYIYDYMFDLGYHGGASKGKPDIGGNRFPHFMAFRTPVPSFAILSGIKPYSFWSNMQSIKSESPSMRIGMDINKYENNIQNSSGNTLLSQVENAFEYVMLGYDLFGRFI